MSNNQGRLTNYEGQYDFVTITYKHKHIMSDWPVGETVRRHESHFD